MRTIACARCARPFEASSNRALYCPSCRPLANNERVQAWATAHPERRRAQRRKWREANPALNEVVAKRWRDANPERLARYRSASKKRNPVANRSYVRVRKARKLALTVVAFTPEQLRQRLSMFAGCWMCGDEADTIDHVKPLSKGGAHMLANLRPACGTCNTRKNDRWPLEVAA